MCNSKGNFKPSGSGRVKECESDTEEEDGRPSQDVLHDSNIKHTLERKLKCWESSRHL